jgi:hypothetical protein
MLRWTKVRRVAKVGEGSKGCVAAIQHFSVSAFQDVNTSPTSPSHYQPHHLNAAKRQSLKSFKGAKAPAAKVSKVCQKLAEALRGLEKLPASEFNISASRLSASQYLTATLLPHQLQGFQASRLPSLIPQHLRISSADHLATCLPAYLPTCLSCLIPYHLMVCKASSFISYHLISCKSYSRQAAKPASCQLHISSS